MQAGIQGHLPPEDFPMCRNKGDEDTDSINSSRSSSSDSTDGHGPCVDQVIPLRSVESNKRRTSQWSSPPRASRGTAVGVALICAITVAISASLCSGCFGWLYRADSDACGGSRRDEAKVKMDDGAAAKKVRASAAVVLSFEIL